MSIVIKRPLTSEQLNQLGKPAQDDINQAANDLIWQLMQRVAALEDNHDPLPTVQSELDNPS